MTTDASDPPRRRGRPRKSPPPPERPPGLDVGDPLAALPPTARHILLTARRVVLDHGYHALTVESAALEAGETPHTVLRHFGSKTGLVEAVLDTAAHDAYVRLVARVGDLPAGPERITAYVEGLSSLAKDTDEAVLLFRIAPHALLDPPLRTRVAALYAWYRELTLRELGLADGSRPQDMAVLERRRLDGVGAVVVAAVDGLTLQAGLDPEGFDVDAAFAVLARMVAASEG